MFYQKIHFCRYLKLTAGDVKLSVVKDRTKEQEIMTGIDFTLFLHYRYVVSPPLPFRISFLAWSIWNEYIFSDLIYIRVITLMKSHFPKVPHCRESWYMETHTFQNKGTGNILSDIMSETILFSSLPPSLLSYSLDICFISCTEGKSSLNMN